MSRPHYYASILFFTFSFMAHAKIEINQGRDRTTYDIHVDGVEVESIALQGRQFSRLKLKGIEGYEGVLYEVGKPELPVVRFFIDGATDLQITHDTHDRAATRALSMPVKPAIDSVEKSPGHEARLDLDPRAYRSSFPSRRERYEIEEIGSVGGKSRFMVTLYPVIYHPQHATIETLSRFRIEVTEGPAPEASGEEQLVFVVAQKFEKHPAFAQYVELKKSLGYSTQVWVVGQQVTTAETIRRKLRETYQSAAGSLKGVILVGDHPEVPAYRSSVVGGVTDHYYRCIDKDAYDSDIGTPDIAVGRLSADTDAQLSAIIEKSVRYELGEFAVEKWLGQISFLASNDSSFWQVIEATDNYVIDTYTAPKKYLGDFPSLNFPGGDKLYAITHKAKGTDAMAKIRMGRGIINYGGHGGVTIWANPQVTLSDIQSLNDSNFIPWVIANACITGNFEQDSIAEAWVRHQHGAVVSVGSVGSTYWDEDDIYQRKMYDGIFKENTLEFSQVLQKGAQGVWQHYGGQGKSKYYYETYSIFGDGSLRLRHWQTTQPQLMVSAANDRKEIRIHDANLNPIPRARLAVIPKAGGTRWVGYSDSTGKVDLPALAAGSYSLVVTGENLRLTQKDLVF